MIYKGKELRTIGEIFDTALELARTNKNDANDFFLQYVEYIMEARGESFDWAVKAAKDNLGYFAGYYSKEVCDLIYDTYKCIHPILGKDPYGVSPEEAYKMGKESIRNKQ